MNIKENLEKLSNLQMIDNELNQMANLKGELPSELEDIERKAAEDKKQLLQLESDIKMYETEISNYKNIIEEKNVLLDKCIAQRDKVTKSREYDALEKQIELYTLDVQISEKNIFRLQNKMIEKRKEVITIQLDLEEVGESMKEKELELEKLIAKHAEQEKILIANRKKVTQEVDINLLDRYDRVRKTIKPGLGVAEIDRGACGACFMYVPLQKRVDISLYEEIQTCDYCGVFLVSTTLNDISEDGYTSTSNPYENESMLEIVEN